VFTYILTACHSQGTRLDVDPTPAAEALGYALLTSVLNRAEVAGIDVSDEDRSSLSRWLGVVS